MYVVEFDFIVNVDVFLDCMVVDFKVVVVCEFLDGDLCDIMCVKVLKDVK